MSVDPGTILPRGTAVYAHDPGVGSRFEPRRGTRHVATIMRPIRDYRRDTAHYYEVRLWNGLERVYSADYIEVRHEGQDSRQS